MNTFKILIATGLLLASSVVSAAMVGDTMQSCFMNTGYCGSATGNSTNLWEDWSNPGDNIATVSNTAIEYNTNTSDVKADFTNNGDLLTVSMPSGGWAEVEFFFENLNLNTTITSFEWTGGELPILDTSFTDHGFYFKVAGGSHSLVDATFAIGSVSAVPVPAAAWLMGSGLLGLVGVARRKKA